MLDLDTIRDEPERVREAMRAKGLDNLGIVDDLIETDEKRREKITSLQDAQERSNNVSQKIGQLKQEGREEEAQEHIEQTRQLKQTIKVLKEQVDDLEHKQRELELEIPNLPHPSVPVGATEDENEVLETFGDKPSFDFDPEPHWTLAEAHNLVDFERGAKVSGSGFPVFRDRGVQLKRALIRYFLDLAREKDYLEVQPPLFVNSDSAMGTGQLPDKEGQMYEIPKDGLYPIPTSEVPITNLHRDEILDADDLPLKYCAHTPCFRREAGSYGKDVRGLNRLHQFDKVELVQIVHPDESYRALEALREDAERPLRELGLPYRRLLMCTGDMGFTQAKKYDLEVWSPGQEQWLEVSSISNFEAFQARRMDIRYRSDPDAPTHSVHTLNGSGLALPRVIAALLEHYQQDDGSVHLPEVLHSYAGFERIA